MTAVVGAAAITAGPELPVLARQLGTLIDDHYTRQGKAVPRALLQHAIALHRAAGLVPKPEPARFRDAAFPPSSAQPVMVSKQAAEVLGTSDRYVRRLIAQGALEAYRSSRGTWLILADSVALLAAQRRKEADRKAALCPSRAGPARPSTSAG